MTKKSRILIVDDDGFSRTFCRQILEDDTSLTVEEADCADEAIARIGKGAIDLVITDLVMPGKSGLELVEWVNEKSRGLPVIIITGHASIESAVKGMKMGAVEYIRKPLNPLEFKIVVHRTLDRKRLAEENRELKRSLKLFNASTRISRTIEIEELYEVVFDLIMQETGAARGLLYLLDQEKGQSSMVITEGFDVTKNSDLDKIFYQSYKEEILAMSSSFIPSVDRSVLINTSKGTELIKSTMFVPLRNKSELVGMVVLFDTEKEGFFGQGDTSVARFLSDYSRSALENAILYSQAKILTITDDLTNVFNYRYLNNILDRELLRVQRLKSQMSVLFLDLDSFKQVNDKFGHLVGSRILVEVAGILKGAVRKVDAVARYGGDEYLVVLTDTGSKGALVVAERIRKRIEKFVFLRKEDYSIRLTASIGVATYPEHASSKIELLNLADEAMYRGKFGQKNMVYLAVREKGGESDAVKGGPFGVGKSEA